MTDAKSTDAKSPAIVIPDALKPSDGRFGAGPSKIRPDALAALAAAGEGATPLLGTSHRQAPVKNLVREVQEGLAQMYDLPDAPGRKRQCDRQPSATPGSRENRHGGGGENRR